MCNLFFQHISVRISTCQALSQGPQVASGFLTNNPLSRNAGWREFIYSEKALATLKVTRHSAIQGKRNRRHKTGCKTWLPEQPGTVYFWESLPLPVQGVGPWSQAGLRSPGGHVSSRRGPRSRPRWPSSESRNRLRARKPAADRRVGA